MKITEKGSISTATYTYDPDVLDEAIPTGTLLQKHPLQNGNTVSITRDEDHKYRFRADDADTWSPNMPGTTSLLEPLEPKFELGMFWSMKMQRRYKEKNPYGTDSLNTIPLRERDRAGALGNALHDAIFVYIASGFIDEKNSLFMAWYNAIGKDTFWITGERFLYHPFFGYGGTLDGISSDENGCVLYDWKTVNRISYDKYGPRIKDFAQSAAYRDALIAMGSSFAPYACKIVYIMRDDWYDSLDAHPSSPDVDIVDVPLDTATALFEESRTLTETMRLARPQ